MKRNSKPDAFEGVLLGAIVLAVVALLISIAAAILGPYFEARTYNKFTTGHKASYWDAVWVELRVTAQKEVASDDQWSR
jgi:hypothetical protein